jgi:hypothetical protein
MSLDYTVEHIQQGPSKDYFLCIVTEQIMCLIS